MTIDRQLIANSEDMPMDEGLRFKCLGSLAVTLDGHRIEEFISNKVPALLIYLVLQPGAHSRSELAGLLWGEVSEEKAKRSLRMALSDLRKKVDPYLDITRQSVEFIHDQPHHIDCLEFEEPISLNELDYKEIYQLSKYYEGDFLQGFYLDEAPLFEEWMLRKRENFRTSVIKLLHRLCQTCLIRGQYDLGIESARQLLEMEPWREEAHRQLMKMYYRSGQRSAALAQYEKCKAVLAEELNAEPTDATRDLYERIQAAEISDVLNLPPSATPFVGREHEISEILELIENPECRLVTIAGVGGIGKSRLASEIATRMRARFLDGVYFVPLAPLESEEMIIPAIAAALNFQFVGRAGPLKQLGDLLQHKEILLILDNFEHLTQGASNIVELIERALDVKLMITSRELLNISWEWVFNLSGLQTKGDSASKSAQLPAVDLFSICMKKSLGRTLNDEELNPVSHICRLLEGIPLGIEIAAAHSATSSVQEIYEEIERDINAVESRMLDARSEHRSLQIVFEQSWNRLSDAEQSLLKALAIFRGGFDLLALEGIVAEALAYEKVLTNLVSKSLVHESDMRERKRFSLLEPVRQFAESKFSDEVERLIIQKDHLDYYLQLAESAAHHLMGPNQVEQLRNLEIDQDNFRAALSFGSQSNLSKGTSLASALQGYWRPRGQMIEGFQWAEAMYEKCDADHPDEKAAMALLASVFVERLGDYDRSIAYAEESLSHYQTTEDQTGLARTSLALAQANWQQSDFENAKEFLKKALEIAKSINDSDLIAASLSLAGRIEYRLSNLDKALEYEKESLELYSEMGCTSALASSLSNLGTITNSKADYKSAVTYLEEALQLYQAVGDRYGESICMGNLGLFLQNQGKFDEAKPVLDRALKLKKEVGDKWGVSWTMSNLGINCIERGDLDRGEALLKSSLAICREQGDLSRAAIDLGNLANIAFFRKDLDGAKELYEESLKIREQIGHQKGIGKSLICLGHVAMLQEEFRIAEQNYTESVRLNQRIGDMQNLNLAITGLVGSWLIEGDLKRAAQLAGHVIAQVTRLGSKISSIDGPMFEQHLAMICAKLDSYEEEFEIGQRLDLDTAIDLALGDRAPN